jgi:hypothetical protein
MKNHLLPAVTLAAPRRRLNAVVRRLSTILTAYFTHKENQMLPPKFLTKVSTVMTILIVTLSSVQPVLASPLTAPAQIQAAIYPDPPPTCIRASSLPLYFMARSTRCYHLPPFLRPARAAGKDWTGRDVLRPRISTSLDGTRPTVRQLTLSGQRNPGCGE